MIKAQWVFHWVFFIVSGVKPLPFRVGGCKSHSEKQFEILYYYDYNDNQVVVKKQHKSSLRLRTVGMTEKYVRACGVSIRLSLVKATDDEAGSPDPLGSRVIHLLAYDRTMNSILASALIICATSGTPSMRIEQTVPQYVPPRIVQPQPWTAPLYNPQPVPMQPYWHIPLPAAGYGPYYQYAPYYYWR